ncbi:hypothetical protein BN874_2950001 [Candidatus Contendobacter odensis Run_B_J11]|uniref:Uncharacterized protein n=1 Tax=Candidatus Contendobacter odensis Run_B_J11 TaxID=1400861 RepID=A0A7U7GCU4_9GAMM|nr:hypothetical protein BN874_2950001 [Candidatus Contendobacter odensis Run_B_J11]
MGAGAIESDASLETVAKLAIDFEQKFSAEPASSQF